MIRRNKQRGSVMVEFAAILPAFLFLAVGGMCMLMAWYTYSNVGYIAQQVAQCRANYLLGGASSAASQCPDPNLYATTLGTAMNLNAMNINPAPNLTVTESTGTPCAGCIQEQVTYQYTPFALIPAISMSQTAVAAVTMYSGTITNAPTTTAIGGNDCLAAPAATVAIPGVTTQMVATASPVQTPPPQDPHIVWYAYVDPNGGQVDLNLCNLSNNPLTPTVSTYNVRVIP